jgi:hypothetical protein
MPGLLDGLFGGASGNDSGGLIQAQPGIGAQPGAGGLLGAFNNNQMALGMLGMGLLSGTDNRDAFRLGMQGAMQGRQFDTQALQQRRLQMAQQAASQDPNLSPQARALIAAGYPAALEQYAHSMFRAPQLVNVNNPDGSQQQQWMQPGATQGAAVGAPRTDWGITYQQQQDGSTVPYRENRGAGTVGVAPIVGGAPQAPGVTPPQGPPGGVAPTGGAQPPGPGTVGGRSNATEEGGARQEFDRRTEGNRDTVDSFNRMVQGARQGTGAGDIAMVFSYMKILDPRSTVREGEAAQASQAAGVPSHILAMYNRLVGGGQLDDAGRRELLHAAAPMAQRSHQDTSTRAEYMRGVAARNRWNPENVTGPMTAPLEIPEIYRAPPTQNTRAQGPAPAQRPPAGAPPDIGWRRAQ